MPKRQIPDLIPRESPLARVNREKGYNWTYAQIARATGIDRSAIARLFERQTLTPDFVTVWKLACLFDVPIEEVVDDAWFRDEDVVSPHGARVFLQFELPPREGWDAPDIPYYSNKSLELQRRLAQVISRRRRERTALGLPMPGRGRTGRAS